jgi:hypothetical protein
MINRWARVLFPHFDADVLRFVISDEALIRLFYGAAERAASVPIEVAPTGLIVEAEGASRF